MLKKLLKHEYKATARFFLPVYLIFIPLLAIQRLSMLLVDRVDTDNQIITAIVGFVSGMFTLVTVLSLIAMLACPLVYALVRFWKNMIGDEGYLTHTLPVTTGKSILAKLIVSETWFVVTAIIALLCGVLYCISIDTDFVKFIWEQLRDIWSLASDLGVGGWLIAVIVTAVLSLLTQLAGNLLTVFDAMSIGQIASKHKLLTSAGAYIGIMFATTTLIQAVLALIGAIFGSDILIYAESISISPSTPDITAVAPQTAQFIFGVLLISIVANCLIATLHFFLSRHFLSKKLNLA